MRVEPIKTRVMQPPKDDLFQVLDESVRAMPEKSILVVTGKVVAIYQGRCVKRDSVDANALVEKEADKFLYSEVVTGKSVMIAIKNNLIVPNAGVDVSNGNGYYVMWPEKPDQMAQEIHEYLKDKFGTREFGVMITDSRVLPLRRGTGGVGLGSYGFCPLKDYRQTRDLFGRKSLKIVFGGVMDSLAASAVLVMGEGNEQTPMAMVSDVGFVEFGDCDKDLPDLEMDSDEDMFAPLLKGVEWKSPPSLKLRKGKKEKV